jgi:hypothetical protein
MLQVVVGICLGALFGLIGWLARYVVSTLTTQIKDLQGEIKSLRSMIGSLSVWQRDHVWTHRHRVVETGSSVDMHNRENGEELPYDG